MAPAPTPSGHGVEDEPLTVVQGAGRLGRYRLLHQLGSGGMATVWLARAEGPAGLERPVAIKRIHAHLAEMESFVEMFLDEARIASNLSHPNVCAVHDVGEVGGVYYLAMEHLVGETLSSILKTLSAQHQDELATRRWHALVARMFADACEGLHAAHALTDEHGAPLDVVHRDVSPSNLFVTYDGAIKVMDFGIASARGRLHQTRDGAIKGKLEYLPPEVYARDAPIDRRFDVWSLGVCLWEALTAQRLFKREGDIQTITAVRGDLILPPSSVQPRIDPALDAIVLGALERDLDRRTESARELGQALSAYVARSGERAGLAELAEWMRSIFAAERTYKLELLDLARRTPSLSQDERDARTEIDRALPGRGTAAATSTVTAPTPDASGERTAPSGAPSHDEDPTVATPSAADEFEEPSTIAVPSPSAMAERRPPPAASSRTLPLPAAVLALLGVGALVVLVVVTVAIVAALATSGDGDAEIERVEPAAVELPAGVVHVATRGAWADVHYGGRRVGRTPHELTLPAGEHDLVLYPEGREPARRLRVTVVPGRTERVLVDLGP